MKKTQVVVMAVAIAFYCAPAFAQHGHGPGGAGPMGVPGGMGASHASASANGAGSGGGGGGTAAAHGKTMDQLLTQNTKLSDKIASLTGESAQQSCSGFKNLGQCVAAAHVSKNLGLSFDCLRSAMTGVTPASGSTCPAGTGTKTLSLGKSIQTLSPQADSKTDGSRSMRDLFFSVRAATVRPRRARYLCSGTGYGWRRLFLSSDRPLLC
jgi:hypothetical protein